ncbi:histidine phosphatase family protein [Roseicitreum antarcticum]|uniref:Alpha-ribazole phosphatase n=1 Tax=Roseicitreum antarcticum TaxID=564137 RepID=A0A1H3CCA6_9RHOB|nr:histidine phosphatase family protein [Roseicitreum antarcticum]SDX51129.1 alpha-ribazole phosphatase [Roseicitreum antarcticum]
MALILVRHTRPLDAAGRCYGRSDLALDDGFEAHAARLVDALPAVARVVTSPLSRCARLAGVIAGARGLPLTTDPRLTEIDFGAWEGVEWDAIPRAALDAWAADLLHARPHGGESVAMLRDRAFAAFAHWGAQGAGQGAGQGGDSLLVTHHGVIKAARFLTEGAAAWSSNLDFGGWITLSDKVVPDAS